MHNLIGLSIKALETLFAVGMIGSAVVILLTTVEDLDVLVEKEEVPSAPEH